MSVKIVFTEEQKNDIIYQYTKLHKSISAISKIYNVSITPIKRVLKENNIEIIATTKINEVGNIYGKLTVIEEAGRNKYKEVLWLCECSCIDKNTGKHPRITVRGADLRNGHTLSCGCIRKDIAEQWVDNLKGKNFGHLKVLYRGESDKHENARWWCQCDCKYQTIKLIAAQDLKKGNTKSCGYCNHISYGNEKILEIFKNNNIEVIPEYKFKDCIDINELVFDFYVPNDIPYCIEFDGRQHFEPYDFSGKLTQKEKEDNYKNRIKKDNIKNKYCIDNNIPLIRIPYWRYDDLCLNDLKLETSQFIYKGESN